MDYVDLPVISEDDSTKTFWLENLLVTDPVSISDIIIGFITLFSFPFLNTLGFNTKVDEYNT